jgi:lactate permease
MNTLATGAAHAASFLPNQTDGLIGQSLIITALVSLVPLAVFFIFLGGFRVSALWSAVAALASALIVAIVGMGMPAGLAALTATQGAAYGLFPIAWIMITAIWFYEVTVISGRFEDLRRVFNAVGRGDVRIQAMLIAFCFGGLLEALAGFGAPVAITGVMLVGLGIPPIRAAIAVLVANTAPVAFGAMAIPITTAGGLIASDPAHAEASAQAVASIVAHQTPIVAWIVPLFVVFVIDKWRGVKQLWPLAVATGLVFSLAQWWTAHKFVYQLTDVIATLLAFAAASIMLRFWTPKTPPEFTSEVEDEKLTAGRVWMAVLPYAIVIVMFGVPKLVASVGAWLSAQDLKIPWPGLYGHLLTKAPDGGAVSSQSAIYSLQWLSSPGTTLFVAALVVTGVYAVFNDNGRFKIGYGAALRGLGSTIARAWTALVTIALVLAIAYVMNFSGQTTWIAEWLASAGVAFAFLSPVIGWLGTAITGSDTSSNALFAKLQFTVGSSLQHPGGPDLAHLFVGANSSGGVVGKMVSPQNLTVAATSIGMKGQESTLLRKSALWSLGMLVGMCVLVFLQSTPVLSWMLAW